MLFCHGLFGQGKNWTQVAKQLADRHRVWLADMPNHGRSGWTDDLDYLDLADRVAAVIDPADPVTLVGHSMGGKIAMVLALRHPELVQRLCAVDIAPVTYRSRSEFGGYVDAMRGLDLSALERRSDADDRLRAAVPDDGVRGFLLQNLRREGDRWRWQQNLRLLGDRLDVLGGWPEDELAGTPPYDGPVLWVAGADSGYVREEHEPAMRRWFPHQQRVTIKKAGHWVHAEQPQVFVEVLRRFLQQG